MNEHMFQRELFKARAHRDRGTRTDYWLGYERGLIRGYRGERFGTDQEHELWLTLAAECEPTLSERGRGYRDGLVVATAEEAA
jgi:hypothetical protein